MSIFDDIARTAAWVAFHNNKSETESDIDVALDAAEASLRERGKLETSCDNEFKCNVAIIRLPQPLTTGSDDEH